MNMITLPWDSEHIVESSKCQFTNGTAGTSSSPGIVSLVSSLKTPTEFALIVVDDDEEIGRQQSASQSGFLGKIKSFANSAASQATKVQRQVTAGCNKLAVLYGVRLVVAVCTNVEFKISGGTLILSWRSVEGSKITAQLEDVSNRFLNVFNTSREIAFTKSQAASFVPNSSKRTFSWLWKYQPIVPMPAEEAAPVMEPIHPVGGGRIVCLSWNVAGLAPPGDNPDNVATSMFTKYKKSLMEFFSSELTRDVDVVVIALQEASPLNAKTVLFKGSDTNYGEAWLEWFTDVLSSSVIPRGAFEFVRTAGIVQVGLAVAMFVRNTPETVKTTAPMTSCVKTGTLGLTGNKGCVGVRSVISFTSLQTDMTVSVLNVHLASGDGKGDFRKNELSRIISEASFGDDKNCHLFDCDLAIVTGDLNSRIAEGTETDGTHIPAEDELLARSRVEGSGFMFSENPVEFPATYKLVPGEEGRLVLADNRKPGWCDRVLFRSAFTGGHEGSGIGGRAAEKSGQAKPRRFTCVEYRSLRDIDLSDHTPVFAVFELAEAGDNDSGDEGDNSTVPAPGVQFDIGAEDDDDNDSDLYDQN